MSRANIINPNKKTLARLTPIIDRDSAGVLTKRLWQPRDRGTTIGGALNEALKLLKTSGPDDLRDGGGQILILTDGAETKEKNQKLIKGKNRKFWNKNFDS